MSPDLKNLFGPNIPLIDGSEKLTPDELQTLTSRMSAVTTARQLFEAADFAVRATFEKIQERLNLADDEELMVDFKTGKLSKRKAQKPKEEVEKK